MRIDKRNPAHIYALAISAVNSVLVSAARPFTPRHTDKVIVFYGHKLNGNLKVFYDYLLRHEGFKPYFLALDQNYYRQLRKDSPNPETILSAHILRDMFIVGRSDVVITSHGLHLFSILRYLTNIIFVDVWHAVSYKGFGYQEFDHLRGHDEVWVSSSQMRDLYIERYGFSPAKVKVTGYGRTDLLIHPSLSRRQIIQTYEIPQAGKYVLIAPTWQQDVPGRSLVPFGVSDALFFTEIDKLAQQHGAHVIFRTHLNSGLDVNIPNLSNTSFMPYSKYEVVEDFLNLADVLVTDWSSVGIDYLPLRRPTIFLDVPAPFRNGFNLGPEHRYGDVVKTFDQLQSVISRNLSHPEKFETIHKNEMDKTIEAAYGTSLDGKSTERYFENLKRVLDKT